MACPSTTRRQGCLSSADRPRSEAPARTSTCIASVHVTSVRVSADVLDAGEHGFLEPAWEMPFSEYQGYLQGTAGSSSEVLP